MANGLMSNFGQEFAGGLRRTGDRFVGHVGTLAALLGQDSPYWEAARQNRARARDESRGLGGATLIGEDVAGGLGALLAALGLVETGVGTAGTLRAGGASASAARAAVEQSFARYGAAVRSGKGVEAAKSAWKASQAAFKAGRYRQAIDLAGGGVQTASKAGRLGQLMSWIGKHKLGLGVTGALAAGGVALNRLGGAQAEKNLANQGQPAPAANLSKDQVTQLVQQMVTGQLAGGAGAGGKEGYGPNEEFSQLMAIANAREQPQGRDLGWGYQPTEYGLTPRTASDVIMRAPLSASRGQRERQRRLDADMAGRYAADTGALRGLAAGVASAGNGQQYDARMRRLEARAAIEPYQQRLLAERAQRGLQGKYMTQVGALLKQGMASEDPAAARAAIQELAALHRGQLGNQETEYGW
jgi:hypothetical protein